MATPDPSLASPNTAPKLTPLSLELKERLCPEKWGRIKARAEEKARIIEEVDSLQAAGMSRRKALVEVAPGVKWPTFLNWCRQAKRRQGAAWERQLDARIPPPPKRTPEELKSAACLLRRMDPDINTERVQELLIEQFGEEHGRVSATVLKRIWKEAGLARPRGGHHDGPREKVTELFGGGALALIGAAAEESGVIAELGEAVAAHAEDMAAEQSERGLVEPGPTEADSRRDDKGRFTADYNRAMWGESARDPRLDPDAKKRERRALNTLHLVRDSAEINGWKLFAMGASPLVTERRGFDGLQGPRGAWLAALGGHAYADTTLDKFLSELALVDAGGCLWTTHAQQWQRVTQPWREQDGQAPWLRLVLYIDATQDPYWTRQFAASGKVSKVGRIMPCLTRVAVMGGPGVPLVVDTYAGSASLRKELLPLLDRMDTVLGEGELGRMTVLDAEMSTLTLLTELSKRPNKWFVTVLKGGTMKAASLRAPGPWRPYRAHDQIRSVEVHFEGKSAPKGGLVLRGVEMVRKDSRTPTSTLFVTNASVEELTLEEVPTAYLSRWPHQEQRFRNGRNGLGLGHTHGYGGSMVEHVALSTKMEKAERRIARAEALVQKAKDVESLAQKQLDEAPHGKRRAARTVLNTAVRERKRIERQLARAQSDAQRLSTMPREIYVRDTTRDGIVTCAKLTVFALIEFVLQEYFGGLRIEPRTFIELFVDTPVTIRETKNELVYELRANPRSPSSTQLLRDACAEVTRRAIERDGKRMRFAVVDP